MSNSAFRQKIYSSFTDEEGLVSVVPNPGHWSTGNGLLYTGLFFTILHLLNQINENDKCNFYDAINKCFVTPGLLQRNPGRPDLDSADDYIGVCAAANFLAPSIADDICFYGSKNLWSFNNPNPYHFSLRSWHGRFPGLVTYYNICAKKKPCPLRQIPFAIKLLIGVPSSPSDTILMWLQVKVYKSFGYFDHLINRWEKLLKKKYGDIVDVFKQYFGENHPFAQLDRGVL